MNNYEDVPFTVWMYGSRARGDYDALSDLDVFIAGQPPQRLVPDELSLHGQTPSVSQYAWSEVETMAAYGSLFLHHLRLEGKPLTEGGEGHSKLLALLDSLPPYRLFRRDIAAFHLTLGDVQHGVTVGSTPEFELSVLGTVMRHASVLACYLLGHPCFSRTGALEQAGAAFDFTRDEILGFCNLYRFRLHESGRCPLPFSASWHVVEHWTAHALRFLKRLEGVADAFEEGLSAVDRRSVQERQPPRVSLPPSHSHQTHHS
jgi:hypothetical protein